jgi:hypothetical protein
MLDYQFIYSRAPKSPDWVSDAYRGPEKKKLKTKGWNSS